MRGIERLIPASKQKQKMKVNKITCHSKFICGVYQYFITRQEKNPLVWVQCMSNEYPRFVV